MSGHTKEPWVAIEAAEGRITIGTKSAGAITRIENTVSRRPLTDEDRANARRIVACVNACEGYSIEELEGAYIGHRPLRAAMVEMKAECDRNARQRDELLEALKRILPQYEALLRDCGLASEHTTDQARAAIARVEAGKP